MKELLSQNATVDEEDLVNRAAYAIALDLGLALGCGQDADSVRRLVDGRVADFEARFPVIAARYNLRDRATQSCDRYLTARSAGLTGASA